MKLWVKITIGVAVVGTVAYLTRDKWLPKKAESKSGDKAMGEKPAETKPLTPVKIIPKEVAAKASVRPTVKSSFVDSNVGVELENK